MDLKSCIRALYIILLATLCLTGCRSTSSSGGSSVSTNKDVQYSINNFEITTNADGVVESTRNDGTWKHLYWECGNYKSQKKVFVSLFLKKTDSTWIFKTDVISHGNCK